MRNVTVTLAVGIALLVLAVAVALTRAPPRVVRAVAQEYVGRGEHARLGLTVSDTAVCQANEVLPAGVSGIRLSLRAFYGAPVQVVVYSGSSVLANGRRGPDWTGQSVTVPVAPRDRASAGVRLCFAIGPNSEPVVILGDPTSGRETAVALASRSVTPVAATVKGVPLGGRVGVEYLAAGRGSWWSRLGSVAQHMGLGRAYSGAWIAFLVAALMVAAGVLAARLTARELP
ncbi:MAG TPA: hypothetical protein VG147_12310 [Solirubrobacteraceae bacterium]|jgi:hypothetical protein|nr:hypothetical protein [Solirubrobacteraceae bacterium]